MSVTTPFWLNEEFLKSVIQNNNPDYGEIRVTQFQAEPVDLRGESYFSNIHRVSVMFEKNCNYCTKECKQMLIVKNLPNTVLASFLTEAMHKEILMYKNISPLMEKLLGFSVMPSCYFAHDNALILQDLLQSGYMLSDRIQQLDYKHCVGSLEALAMFHAASILINEKNPEYVKTVGKETYFMKENTNTGKAFTLNGFKLLADEMKSSPELVHLSEKLYAFGTQAWDKIVDVTNQEYRVSVLNHGDFWCNNIMFLYDLNGKIKNIKLIDLQFCRWTTAAFDLHMFFNTSVRDLNSVNELTEIYRKKFNTCLSEMGSSVHLSKEQLDEDLQVTKCYGLVAAVTLLPICVCDQSDPMDLQQTTNNDFENNFINHNPYAKLYRGKKFKALIPGILETYECKGVI